MVVKSSRFSLVVQLKNMDVADLTPEHLGPCACVTFRITRIDFQTQCYRCRFTFSGKVLRLEKIRKRMEEGLSPQQRPAGGCLKLLRASLDREKELTANVVFPYWVQTVGFGS